jgi:hypothetical protein
LEGKLASAKLEKTTEERDAKFEATIEGRKRIHRFKKDGVISGYATAVSDLRASVVALTALQQAQQYELVTVRGSMPPLSRQYLIPLGSAPPPLPPLRFDAEWCALSITWTKFRPQCAALRPRALHRSARLGGCE